MKPSIDLSHKYLELLKEMITKQAKPGDNFMMELRYRDPKWTEVNIWYSRYHSGGSYQSLCSVNFHDIVEVYKYSKYDINAKESEYMESFDLAAPDCFDKVVDIIIKTANIMQLDRRQRLFPIEQLEPPNVWERASA